MSYLSDRLLQEGLSLPSRVALRLSNCSLVEKYILEPKYQKAVQKHKSRLPALATADQEIVDALNRDGLYVTSLDHLQIPATDNFFTAALALTQILEQRSKTPTYCHTHTLTALAHELIAYPEIVHWGASERILRIVEHYLGLPVAYDALSFYYSIADGRSIGPRKWHRDKEDWKMIKVAIYITDVDHDSGPFECVDSPTNQYLFEEFGNKFPVFHHDAMQNQLQAKSNNWYKSVTGPAGTVVFCDTARYYHRGCPPIVHNRSAIFFGYFSHRPKHPFFCERSPLSRQQIRQLSMALPIERRKHLTWTDELSMLMRMFPKNRVRV